jgi:hypothetical protein
MSRRAVEDRARFEPDRLGLREPLVGEWRIAPKEDRDAPACEVADEVRGMEVMVHVDALAIERHAGLVASVRSRPIDRHGTLEPVAGAAL